jgi:3-oxoacyl-[acyl-carrier protein] reductase
MKTALVLGGTGVVGAAVLKELARREVTAAFGFHASGDKAKALATEYGHTAFAIDLADAAATRVALDAQATPDVVIHCAGVAASQPMIELDVTTWQRAVAVNVQSAMLVIQWLAQRHKTGEPARHVVLVGGLDRAQSLPLPAGFAATQGALNALTMALGHELGPKGVFVNLVALGVLEGGLSRELVSKRIKEYETFSALRRRGTADEAAKVITWLALENTYIQGKVLSVNGGI